MRINHTSFPYQYPNSWQGAEHTVKMHVISLAHTIVLFVHVFL